MSSDSPNSAVQLLNRRDLKAFGISLSNTQLLRLEALNRFPRRVYISAARVAWIRSEIDEWLAARSAERVQRKYSDACVR